ncbi:MAG: hypothetical protein IPI00_12515 [Flavobacteriales bacterium]|nr:hypothetical protein [Flavobacteriales bacterium]
MLYLDAGLHAMERGIVNVPVAIRKPATTATPEPSLFAQHPTSRIHASAHGRDRGERAARVERREAIKAWHDLQLKDSTASKRFETPLRATFLASTNLHCSPLSSASENGVHFW